MATTQKLIHGPASPSFVAAELGGKYLTFRLADEDYGVEILKVREINGMLKITAVPHMPPYVKGVINLRGKVLPAIDLRLKFGLPSAETTEQTCIIVVDVGHEMGIIVDTVSEVLDIPSEKNRSASEHGRRRRYVDHSRHGQGRRDGVKILLDIDRVLGTDELDQVVGAIPVQDDCGDATRERSLLLIRSVASSIRSVNRRVGVRFASVDRHTLIAQPEKEYRADRLHRGQVKARGSWEAGDGNSRDFVVVATIGFISL